MANFFLLDRFCIRYCIRDKRHCMSFLLAPQPVLDLDSSAERAPKRDADPECCPNFRCTLSNEVRVTARADSEVHVASTKGYTYVASSCPKGRTIITAYNNTGLGRSFPPEIALQVEFLTTLRYKSPRTFLNPIT